MSERRSVRIVLAAGALAAAACGGGGGSPADAGPDAEAVDGPEATGEDAREDGGGGEDADAGGDAGIDGDGGEDDGDAGPVRLAASAWPMYQHDPRHTGRSAVVGPAAWLAGWPEVVAREPAVMPVLPDGLPAGPPPLADGEICCDGVWAPITITASDDLLVGTVMRYDFEGVTSYFAGPGNPEEIGPSGILHAIAPDGTLRYRFDADIGSPAISAIESGALVLADGTSVFGKDDGHVYALDAEGRLAWQFPPAGPASDVVDVFDTTDAQCTMARAYSDPATCFLDGLTCQDNEQFVPSPSLGPEGNLYVASIWANVWVAHRFSGAPPAGCEERRVADGRLPIWGKVRALDPRNGALRWTKDLSDDGIPRAVWSGPAVAPDGTVYVSTWSFGGDGGEMYGTLFALASDGVELWKYPAAPDDRTAPCSAATATCAMAGGPMIGDDGTIYVGGSDRLRWTPRGWNASAPLLAIRPDGTLKWSFAGYNDLAHTGYDEDGDPVSFAAGTAGAAPGIFESPALAPDGAIVFSAGVFATEAACRDAPRLCRGFLVKVRDAGSAAELVWLRSVPQAIRSAPAIDAAGNIYVGTGGPLDLAAALAGVTEWPDGTVWAVDAGGDHLWHHTFANGSLNKSFAIGSDGSLYVATRGRPYGVFRFGP